MDHRRSGWAETQVTAQLAAVGDFAGDRVERDQETITRFLAETNSIHEKIKNVEESTKLDEKRV